MKAKLVKTGTATWELDLLNENGGTVHTTTTERRGAIFAIIRSMGLAPESYRVRRTQGYAYIEAPPAPPESAVVPVKAKRARRTKPVAAVDKPYEGFIPA